MRKPLPLALRAFQDDTMDGEMHTPLAFCCPPVVSPVMKVALV
jgi:hypothetical protein